MDQSNLFWDLLEYKIGFPVPLYLRNLLSLQGFDNPLSIKRMDEKDFVEIQTYATSDKIKKRIPKDANLQDYYGTFHENPSEFEIILGHKKLLKDVIIFVQENLNAEGARFFDQFDHSNKGFTAFLIKKNRTQERLHKPADSLKTDITKSPFGILGRPQFRSKADHSIESTSGQNNDRDTQSDINVDEQNLANHEIDDNMDLDFDLNEEQMREQLILFGKIGEWFKSYDQNVFQKYFDKYKDDIVKVIIEDTGTIQYFASIFCPLCEKYMRIKKTSRDLRSGSKGKLTWNISNYTKHVQTHNKKIANKNAVVKQDITKTLEITSDNEKDDNDNRKRLKIDKNSHNVTNVRHTTTATETTANSEKIQNNEDLLSILMDDSSESVLPDSQSLNVVTYRFEDNQVIDLDKLTTEINRLASENKVLKDALENAKLELEKNHQVFLSPDNNVLEMFMDAAISNVNRSKNGYRHIEVIKMFMAYVKMLGGAFLYETLYANLTMSIPSSTTVNRFLTDKGPHIVEGILRVNELKSYLLDRNLPLIVIVSEDATRNVGKICYDSSTNQLVGFVLPLDKNGMPKSYNFKARNAKEIEGHFLNEENTIATMAYTLMAQPLSELVPPFCLTLFGTDNKFNADQVKLRWKFIKQELKKKEIDVLTYASDGDSRLLKAMKEESKIGMSSGNDLECKWLSIDLTSPWDGENLVYIQDPTHLLTKWRNRILRASAFLAMGDKLVTNTHLKYLIAKISKDKHLLTKSDLEPKDRQNFRSAEKICHARVRNCLKENVPGSEATVVYLKMMNYAVFSLMDPKIPLVTRIEKIWYAVFVARIWKSWLSTVIKANKAAKIGTKNYSLRENFMSSNSYSCLEVNAHSLIKLIINLRESNQQHLFLPTLLGSQPCESTFRQVRSFTSTYSTVVNCTISDMLHRLRKIQLQSDIITKCTSIKFPRNERKTASTIETKEFPSNKEIFALIEKARAEAMDDLKSFGIEMKDVNFCCQIYLKMKGGKQGEQEECERDEECEDEDCYDDIDDDFDVLQAENTDEDEDAELIQDIHTLTSLSGQGQLIMKDYSETNASVNEESPHCIVLDGIGRELLVRKSSVCWLLSQQKHTLSSDRLVRVQDSELIQNKGKGNNNRTNDFKLDCLDIKEDINIGEWSLFNYDNKLLIGLVLSFCYLNGKNYREREYSRSFASVKSEKPIGVLCNYYSLDVKSGFLKEEIKHHSYIDLKNYQASIGPPSFTNEKLHISNHLVEKIDSFILQGIEKENTMKTAPVVLENINVGVGDFVIVSVKTNSGVEKLFVGKIANKLNTDEFEVLFMKKAKPNTNNFVFPRIEDRSTILRNEIKRILEIPQTSRRGELVFHDLSSFNEKIY